MQYGENSDKTADFVEETLPLIARPRDNSGKKEFVRMSEEQNEL